MYVPTTLGTLYRHSLFCSWHVDISFPRTTTLATLGGGGFSHRFLIMSVRLELRCFALLVREVTLVMGDTQTNQHTQQQ